MGPAYPSNDILSRQITKSIRVASEKFWFDYLSESTWSFLLPKSREDLIDAQVHDYFVKKEIFSDRTLITYSLCKAVEREIARVMFDPWREHFANIEWEIPNNIHSKTEYKKIQFRTATLDLLKKSAKLGKAPTLGQLGRICTLWNDPVIDTLTRTFSELRSDVFPHNQYHENITKIGKIIAAPLIDSRFSLVDIRNSSDHPQNIDQMNWETYVNEVKKILGHPPKKLLALVCFEIQILLMSKKDS